MFTYKPNSSLMNSALMNLSKKKVLHGPYPHFLFIQFGDYLEIVMIPTHKPHIFFMVTIICISKMYTVIKYPQPFYDTIWRLPWKKFEIPIHKPYIFLVDGHEIMHWLTYQTSVQEVTPSHCTNYLEKSIFLYFSMHTERLFYVPFLG